MARRKLTSFEIESFVEENRYLVNKESWFLSRCIDGRYEKEIKNQKSKVKNLEPLAKPGADIGDLMMVFSANNEYGLLIEEEKIFAAVLKTVGGWRNFRFHTDEHSLNPNNQIPNSKQISNFSGCGHFKQAGKDPIAYGLEENQIKLISEFLVKAKKNGAKCEVLAGEHLESAVLMIEGERWSIYPQLVSQEFPNEPIEVFVYQKTLDDKRRRILTKNLLPYVKASFSVEEEYLYQVLSQVADNQLLETLSRLAKDLPMYEVLFEKDGEFEIRQL